MVVDLGKFGALPKTLADGKLSVQLSNKDITYVKQSANGIKPALPESCPIDPGLPTPSTIAALEWLARKGLLYFNVHTKANTFYGEMRGQIYPAP
jgi:CHRD domain